MSRGNFPGRQGWTTADVDDVGGDDAVVVDVGAAGVSFPDLLLLRGEYQLRLEPPFVPGMEVAGVVRSAPYESEFTAGTTGYGAVDARRLGRTGGGAAGQPDAHTRMNSTTPRPSRCWATTRRCISRWPSAAPCGQARRCWCSGSAGGVGTAAVQIAKALGATGDRDGAPAAGAGLRGSLGADVVLPLTDGWLQAVKDHTDGRGVDLVVDPIGGEAFDDAVRALDTEGRLLVIGFAAGGIPTVKVNRLLLRNVSVIGVGYGEYVNRKPGSQSVFEFGVAELVKAGLRPPPPMRYPLAEGSAALQSLADGGVLGKVVLEP